MGGILECMYSMGIRSCLHVFFYLLEVDHTGSKVLAKSLEFLAI